MASFSPSVYFFRASFATDGFVFLPCGKENLYKVKTQISDPQISTKGKAREGRAEAGDASRRGGRAAEDALLRGGKWRRRGETQADEEAGQRRDAPPERGKAPQDGEPGKRHPQERQSPRKASPRKAIPQNSCYRIALLNMAWKYVWTMLPNSKQ